MDKMTGEESTTVQEAAVQQEAAVSGDNSDKSSHADDFRSMRESMKEMKSELTSLRGENSQMRTVMTQRAEKVVDPFEGRDGSDYLTIDEQRQRETDLLNKFEAGKKQLARETEAITFLSSHSDYETTMNKYGKLLPTELRQFLIKNPADPDAMKAAYAACKDSSSYYRDNLSTSQHDNAKRAVENMSKPGAGSSAGSGGTVSLSNKLKNMTTEERIAYSDRCIREGGR